MPESALFPLPGERPGLDAVHDLFDPARLTQARQARALTKRALAEALGVSPAAVGQYEAGVTRPRSGQVQRLADLLDVPPDFFVTGRPRAGVDVSRVHFRSLRSMPAYERDRALVFVDQLWELSQVLERHVHLPAVDLPPPSGPYGSSPAAAARWLRECWDLGDEPIGHLVRLLEQRGVLVGLLPFSDAHRVDAFSTTHTPRPVIVLSSDRDDVHRHRFTAAHELGHLVLHHEAHPGDARHEREANAFAAEFLTPAHRLAPLLLRRVDFARLIRLQKQWGVSPDALLYRSQELGVISAAAHRRSRIRLAQLRTQGAARPEPVADYPGELPRLLSRAAAAAKVTSPVLAAQLAWHTEQVDAYLGTTDHRPRLELVTNPTAHDLP